MSKVILVILDAFGFEASTKRSGFLEHLTESGKCAKYKILGDLPSASRPMYETIMTGLPVWQHGISSNGIIRSSRCENLFSLTKKNGLVNAAAAYSWMYELYCSGKPFSVHQDRYALESSGSIMHGIYYCEDYYPDSHLYADAEFLRRMYCPDFLVIHPMNVDFAGHKFGAASREYAHAGNMTMDQIAQLYESWIKDGYELIVTADHGMDELGHHGGNEPIQRCTPLFIVSDKVAPGSYTNEELTTCIIAPLVCHLMNIAPAAGMIHPNAIHGIV